MSELETSLGGTVWRLSDRDGSLIAPVLVLLEGGVIGGSEDPAKRRWLIRDGKLAFADKHGMINVVFDVQKSNASIPTVLTGRMIREPAVIQQLDRTDLPVSPLANLQVSTRTPISAPLQRRENLVVLRANNESLHTLWQRAPEDERSWDLCISWYDKAEPIDIGSYEYFVDQSEQRKFAAVHDLFVPESPLWQYDYIWLPDDDLITSWSDINRVFEISRRHGLSLSQPALGPGSFISHEVTRQDDRFAMRFVRFVEVMCPIFSRSALRLCLPTFRGAYSGWGLDHIWPRLLGDVANRIAIIDEVAVVHTRPTDRSDRGYDAAQAQHEYSELLHRYQALCSYETIGCILRGKNPV